jgi:tetratricopeptide (TPR) repeat protein
MLCGDLLDAGKLDEAASVANDVIKSEPLNFDGLMAVADIQRRQRKFPESIESYKKVLFLNDKYAPAYAGRAEAHLGMREYDRAEGFYKKALELDPKLAAAELGLSRVYKAQNKNDQRMAHLNRAKMLDPNNKDVQEEFRQLSGPSPAPAPAAAPTKAAPPTKGGAKKGR